jgi:multidrug efflux system outer membrane protein
VTSNEYYANVGVSYELDLWGRYQHASDAAKARLLASELDRETVLLSLSGDIARGISRCRPPRASCGARARRSSIARSLCASRRSARKAVKATSSRCVASRRRVAAARTSTQQFELEATRRANALAVLLGRSPREMFDERIATADETRSGSAPTLPPGLPSAVLERRPDIRAAEAELEARRRTRVRHVRTSFRASA